MNVALSAALPVATPREARRRRLFTLVAALLAAIYGARVLVAATVWIFDPDVWWVAAAGREILTTRLVPTQNLFSFVEPAHPWVMHEWLLGVPYAFLVERMGPAGFALVALGVAASALLLIVWATVGRARLLLVGLAMASVALCCFGDRFLTARPTHIALLFPLLLTPVAFGSRFSRESILVAATVECIWTNSHGSFPLGIAVLAAGALDQPIDRARRILGTVVAASMTFVNPYGLSLHRLVLGYAGGNDGIYREIHQHITEFDSILRSSAVDPRQQAALAALSVVVIGMFFARKYRARAVLCALLIGMAIRQARQCEVAGLLTCSLIVPYLDGLLEGVQFASLDVPGLRRKMALILTLPPIAVGIAAFAMTYRSRTPDEWLGEGAPFVHVVEATPDDARAFVPFHDAGQAIWYGWPRGIRVYYDPRNDCYDAATFRSFRELEFGPLSADAGTKLSQAGADTAIVPRGAPLAERLAEDDSWTRVRGEGDWLLYRTAPESLVRKLRLAEP